MTLAGLLSDFFAANRRVCNRIERSLPRGFVHHLHRSYEDQIAARTGAAAGWTIVDIGGGRACPYMRRLDPARGHAVIALEYLEDELRHNHDVTLKVASDVVAGLPLRDASIDLITSRSVMEHLNGVERFIANCAAAVKPGGLIVHSFPSRFSPFSLVNQAIPNRLARRLLFYFHPGWVDDVGFKAYYDHCWHSAMRATFERHGFEIVHQELRYYQSVYCNFFVPAYLAMLAYDLLVWAAGAKNLCAQVLLIGRRRPT